MRRRVDLVGRPPPRPRPQPQPPIQDLVPVGIDPGSTKQDFLTTITRIKPIVELLGFNLPYTGIYSRCIRKPCPNFLRDMFFKYQSTFKSYFIEAVLPSFCLIPDDPSMRDLTRLWIHHKTMIRWLAQFLWYADQYVTTRESCPQLSGTSLPEFLDLVLSEIRDKVPAAALFMINRDRRGAHVDRANLKCLIDALIAPELGSRSLYISKFEAPLIERTTVHYSAKACDCLRMDTPELYMLKVVEWMKEEEDRASHYLPPSSLQKMLAGAEVLLVSLYANPSLENVQFRDDKMDHLLTIYRRFSSLSSESLAENHRSELLRKGKLADLIRLYEIYAQVGLGSLNQKYKLFVAEQLVGIDSKEVCIERMIPVYDRCMQYVRDCFEGSILFSETLQVEISDHMIKVGNPSESSELFANFCDRTLKLGDKKEVFAQKIHKAVRLLDLLRFKSSSRPNSTGSFRCMAIGLCYRDKLYGRLACRRVNFELERLLLGYSEVLGIGCVQERQMKSMLDDKKVSIKLQSLLRSHLRNSNVPKISKSLSLSVRIRTPFCWPRTGFGVFDMKLPKAMEDCMEAFKGISLQHQRGIKPDTKLMWDYSMGVCVVSGSFESRALDLVVTPCQAAVLHLFNDSDMLSFKDINEQLKMPVVQLIGVLHSLSRENYRILSKMPNHEPISLADQFVFNEKFTHDSSEIKVPLPAFTKYPDRFLSNAVKVTILRIIRHNNSINYWQLVKQCVELLAMENESRTENPTSEFVERLKKTTKDKWYVARILIFLESNWFIKKCEDDPKCYCLGRRYRYPFQEGREPEISLDDEMPGSSHSRDFRML